MSRLQAEIQRLYGLPATASDAGPEATRVLVLGLTHQAGWPLLSQVWRGVQADLGWPAPAIAVNGVDGLQLWFSVAAPVAQTQGGALLASLCRRYLPEVPARCLVLLTADAPAVPVLRAPPDQWSAFVSADLAPLFSETPWLDVPPGDDGQAQLLAPLACITPAQWAQAQETLAPVPVPAPRIQAQAPPAPGSHPPMPGMDPQRFLWAVMNDDSAPLALRVEAAKALLPYSAPPARQ